MRVTVSLNEEMTFTAAQKGGGADLRALLEANSGAEIVRIYGRGRFASIEASDADLEHLKKAIGDRCVFALKAQVQSF
jgi:hypothetical protein